MTEAEFQRNDWELDRQLAHREELEREDIIFDVVNETVRSWVRGQRAGRALPSAFGRRDMEGKAALFGGTQRIEEAGQSADTLLYRGLEVVPAGGAESNSGLDLALKVHDHDRFAGDTLDFQAAQIFQGDGDLANQGAHAINHTGPQPVAALLDKITDEWAEVPTGGTSQEAA